MKRLIQFILCFCFVLALVLTLSACDKFTFPGFHLHSFGEWETSVKPTCTEHGVLQRFCECGEKQTEDLSPLGHTKIEDAPVNPTCAQTGLTKGSHCSACDIIIDKQQPVAALGHKETPDQPLAPTCTETGLTEGSHCFVCQEVLTEQKTVPALGHTEVIDAAIAPTCTLSGLTEGKHCSVCGEVTQKQQTIPEGGHTKVIDPALAPTCTETGLTEGLHCFVCEEILIAQQTVQANGHRGGEWVIDFSPTCTQEGQKHQLCSVCNATIQQESIEAKGHTFGEWITVLEATCQLDGQKKRICECGTIEYAAIEALGHIDGSWVIDREATCAQPGLKHQVCDRCRASIQESRIPALGHDIFQTPVGKNCTTDGKTIYECSRCDHYKDKAWRELSCSYSISYLGWGITGAGEADIYRFNVSRIVGSYFDHAETDPNVGKIGSISIIDYYGSNVKIIDQKDLYDNNYDYNYNLHLARGYEHTILIELDSVFGEGIQIWLNTDGSSNVVQKAAPHNYTYTVVPPTEHAAGKTISVCSGCSHSITETWDDIQFSFQYNPRFPGDTYYTPYIGQISGGAIIYKDGQRVSNTYFITVLGEHGNEYGIYQLPESTGFFSMPYLLHESACKFHIVISDGYSTYIYDTEISNPSPQIKYHNVPLTSNDISFELLYESHSSYPYLVRYKILNIRGGSASSEGTRYYTVTVKNTITGESYTKDKVKEVCGIVCLTSYTTQDLQYYEISISDGINTYVYTSNYYNPTPVRK